MNNLILFGLIIILIAGNIICFLFGARLGQTVSKGEKVELPNLNPLEAYRKHEAKKEAEAEQDKFDTIMKNIECYDGTTKGQKDVG